MEPSAATSQQCAEVNNLNSKLGYDAAAQIQNQGLLDNQEDARAWSAFKLKAAQDQHTVTHLAQINAVISAQTGDTSNQQTTSPVRTATGDAIVGGVGVSAEQVAANVANIATALTPVIASALATALSQTITAVLPALITAVGGASTPSQTQPKPATPAAS